jgi:hypothetical protein
VQCPQICWLPKSKATPLPAESLTSAERERRAKKDRCSVDLVLQKEKGEVSWIALGRASLVVLGDHSRRKFPKL